MIKFEDIEIMPGCVIKNDDPKKLGRIKVSVPLWFNTETMHINAINWVYPMLMQRFQSFSKMELGRKVWVLHEKTNYYDYQYIPMFEINDDLKKILETSYNNTEVVFSRCKGDVTAQLYFNDDEGIISKYGNAYTAVTAENDIKLSDGECTIGVIGSQVHLGKEANDKEPAVMGITLKNLLISLVNKLIESAQAFSSDGYVPKGSLKMSTVLNDYLKDLNNAKLLSDNVFVYL